MCEPTTMALMALQGASTVSAIQSQNSAAVANSQHAISAGNDETASTTEQYIEQSRSLIQGGFDAILEGRANEALAYTSAIENGVQGASVKAMLRDRKQKTGRSAGRTNQEIDSLTRQTGANYKHIASKTQGRINSVPTTSFGLGDLAKIAAPAVRAEME